MIEERNPMKKFSTQWKKKHREWHQKHTDGKIYRHYIQNDTEYSKPTNYRTLKDAFETGLVSGKCSKPNTLGKHYKRPSKKHLSAKQKKSLSKGRKVLKYLRTGRAISEAREPILIKEGGFLMEGKGKKKKSGKKYHGFEGGFEGKKKAKKTSHKKSHYLHGAGADFDLLGLGVDIAGLLAGAIGLSFVASLIPIKNPKIKTAIPIGAGILGLSLPIIAKNRFLNRISLGALSIGGYSLTKQLAPKLPLMGGVETAEGIGAAIENLPPEEKAILGILPLPQIEYTGQDGEAGASAPGEMLGETTLIEGMPGEMLGEYEPVNAE